MGCAPIAHTLFSKVMKYNPANPKWVSTSQLFFVAKAARTSNFEK